MSTTLPVVPGPSVRCEDRHRVQTSFWVGPASFFVLHVPSMAQCFLNHQEGHGGNHFFYLRQLALGVSASSYSELAEVLLHKGELWLDRGCRTHDDCRRNKELGLACQPHSHVTELWNRRSPAPSQLWGGERLVLGAGRGRTANMTTHLVSNVPLWSGDILTMECESERDSALVVAEVDFEVRWHWTASP